jgi:hypothetical protein
MENHIEIYKSNKDNVEIQVQFEKETVWLNQYQLADLFDTDRTSVLKHIQNIYATNELDEVATCAKFAQVRKEGNREVKRNVLYYNLDIIISVGYKVNSIKGTQFRQWATQRLKDYLVKGYALNKKRLKELHYKYSDLQQAIKLAANAGNVDSLSSTEATGILKVIEQYAYALETLDKYDHQKLTIDIDTSETEIQKLSYEEAIHQINIWRDYQKAGKLFGNEKDQSFKSSLETIYQTFDVKRLICFTLW